MPELEKNGIAQSFVLDPETHIIYEWNKGLVEIIDLQLANGIPVAGETIWCEFNNQMKS